MESNNTQGKAPQVPRENIVGVSVLKRVTVKGETLLLNK